MYAPTTAHMVAVKRILRYLKGTLGFGLTFAARSSTHLTAFSDASCSGVIGH